VTSEPFLRAEGLSKSYGLVEAVREVDFSISPNEIVALVGDNGAGKSTLIKMLAGAVEPDSGTITIDGKATRLSSPSEAKQLGIETVHQDLALLPNLDVTTNVFLGREIPARGIFGTLGFVARRRMRAEARQHLEELHISLPQVSGKSVDRLSGGQRQSVAVARAIVWARRLLIMDEPTAALGVAQASAVLELAQRARERGTSVVIISHILPHVLRIADRVVVLRHGQKVAELPASEVSEHLLIELIVGVENGSA
jgi:simple sugar transport system ATP-binding protein